MRLRCGSARLDVKLGGRAVGCSSAAVVLGTAVGSETWFCEGLRPRVVAEVVWGGTVMRVS